MQATLELLDPLRRRMALWLLPLGSLLALVALWASRQAGPDPVDRAFLPLLALGLMGMAAFLWQAPARRAGSYPAPTPLSPLPPLRPGLPAPPKA